MFFGMPGGCQGPTRSRENTSSEAQESVQSNEALSENKRQISWNSTQPGSEEGKRQCPALNASHYCLSLQGRRLSPHKKGSKIQAWHCNQHSRCLDFHVSRRGLSELSFSRRKSPQKSFSQNKGTNSRVAWMSLDGLLVNVDEATSIEMGKILGHQETIGWNGFAPLQKVLVVAITAAATSAAKQRHTKDMRDLQLAIATRDKDCKILQEKVLQLQEHLSFWKERVQNLCEDMEATGKEISHSPLLRLGIDSTPKCDSEMLEQFVTPQIEQGLVRMPDHIACFRRNLSFKKYRALAAHLSKESTEDSNEEKTFLDRLSESPLVIEEQSTPQMPLTQLNKIKTPSNNVSPEQVGHLNWYCQKGCRTINIMQDSLMSHVPCTEHVLQPKEQLSEDQKMINENCGSIDERLSKESDQSVTSSDLSCSRNSKVDDMNVDSVIQAAVRGTVDKLLAPLKGRHHFVNHPWSSDMVIEQLLGELENAAAKVASMEAEIKSLQDSQRKETEEHLGESRFHTCDKLETTLELLKDTEKRLASCREACKKKDKAISKLEDEVAALQGMVLELRSLQATSKVAGHQDPSPVQTFLTSNLLFNLDSPVKIGSPLSAKSSFSSWKGLDELSKVSDSLESESRESRRGSCDSEMSGLERVRAWQTHGNREERECTTSVLQVESVTTEKHTMKREISKESRTCRSNEEVRRSSGSTDEPNRKSSSSSTDEISSYTIRHGRLPKLPRSNYGHARKLKFSNAADLRFPDDKDRRIPSCVEAAGGGRRHDGSLGNKASNVLAGVEPNTPMRDRKLNGSGKDNKIFGQHSLDSLNKAKENFAHRRRWM